jgi:hypothetical protein
MQHKNDYCFFEDLKARLQFSKGVISVNGTRQGFVWNPTLTVPSPRIRGLAESTSF